ncbi:MAG: T9SS type A sorting domain-containing protein [Bacteroidia bacterium]|nr:T9SS type A sorting domain-containing protein [Bacteroidia bacterium]
MKKFLLPFTLLVLILLLAATPFVPTSYGLFSTLEATDNGPSPVLPANGYEYANPLLPHYLEDNQNGFGDHYNPPTNTLTNAGARLGRVLFYDTRLSKNKEISCASCHVASLGFSDSSRFSKGFDGEKTTRQSMTLTNARVQPSRTFFWDASTTVLQDQISMAITSSVEMGMEFREVEQRLRETDFYSGLFADAFGTANITESRITAAIGQFVRSMISKNSKFDLAAVQENKFTPPFQTYTQLENDGFQLFVDLQCQNCHLAPHFAGSQPANNGLDATNDKDKGLGEHTTSTFDDGLFKAPQLRNIELTAPYMHDGRFNTLEEVIEHYNSGIENNPNLAPELRDPSTRGPRRMKLSTYQKEALIAFLKSLTDPYFATDPRFEDPFAITEAKEMESTPMDKVLNRQRFGINGLEAAKVNVFPNPFTELLTVELNNPSGLRIDIEIFDLSGRKVFSQSEAGSSFKIARGDMRPGNYVLTVNSLMHSWSQKVVIK